MTLLRRPLIPSWRALSRCHPSHSPAGLVVAFNDDHAVANAGLLLPATLAERLDIEAVIDELVDLGDRLAPIALAARC
jgi:hypothetical protein